MWGRNNAELARRWRARAQVQAYRLEQRLASFATTPEQDAYLLAKTGPAALSAIPRQIVTFRMLRKRALQVRARARPCRARASFCMCSARLVYMKLRRSACCPSAVKPERLSAYPSAQLTISRRSLVIAQRAILAMHVSCGMCARVEPPDSASLLQVMVEEIKARAAKAREGGEVQAFV